jgi:hypothetical protein
MGIEKTSLIHSHLPICLDVTINKRHNCRCKNNCAPQSKGMFRMQCSKHTQQASNWWFHSWLDLALISGWWNIFYKCNLLWITCCLMQNGMHVCIIWRAREILQGCKVKHIISNDEFWAQCKNIMTMAKPLFIVVWIFDGNQLVMGIAYTTMLEVKTCFKQMKDHLTTKIFGFCNCCLQLKFSCMRHMQLQICVVA